MLKRVYVVLVFAVLIMGCKSKPKEEAASSGAGGFEGFKNDFVETLWRMYPVWASGQGYHKYDSVLTIPDGVNRSAEMVSLDALEKELKGFEFAKLNANDKTDYKLIQNFIDGARFNANEFKEFEWNPAVYNVGDAIDAVMNNSKGSLEVNLNHVSSRLAMVPKYYSVAREQIHKPTREHTALAIKQSKGLLYFFDAVFPDSLKKSGLSEVDKNLFKTRADSAKAAIVGYVNWLEKEVQPKLNDSTSRSFRIGKDLYAKKFQFDIQSHYTAAEIYQKALDRKVFLHTAMYGITKELWQKYFDKKEMPKDSLVAIRTLIDKISEKHCKRDEFMQTIEKQLPELVQFIHDHNIITLDSTKPLKVRKTPEYMAGVAGASINSPGPYDKEANTYYNVTPLTNYSAEDAESYLREYNDYVRQILNIHEAIPGHYTQLIYANRSPSIIKAILGNGAMIEGWACYVERMMIEEGYNKSPEMQLFYYKWNLREVCNTLLDYNLQCNNWTEDQIFHLLADEAFQQKTEAKEKYKRASLSQVQLASYFTGLTEIYELREEMKKKQGAQFNLKQFHEQFLSFGSAPVKEIRDLMLP